MTDEARERNPQKSRDRYSFKVQGLDCAEEMAVLRDEVGPLVGGEDNLAFDVLSGRMIVLDRASAASPDQIIEAVRRTGMTVVELRPDDRKSSEEPDRRRHSQLLFTSLSGLFVAAGFIAHVWLEGGFGEGVRLLSGHEGEATPLPELICYALAIVCGIRFVVAKAWFALRSLRPDMNLLMVIAVAGAVSIGQWFEAATVSFLFALSLTLESWSVARARRAIASLLDLAPPTVRLLRADRIEEDAPVFEVEPGELFIVRAGERIGLDGRVTEGASSVDQSSITGESVPVEKTPGAEVFAGTINGDGVLTVEAGERSENTMLARIIRLVEEAHAGRAPSEQWVERFARVYTPSVMVIAILVSVVPPLALGGAWGEWFYRALVLLVIACPCALVISTPVSIVAALASSARAGVLIKGGAYIELPSRIAAIAMDKTGTITRGTPEVVRVLPFGNHTEAELVARAAALEARSTHPLARAIIRYATQQGVVPAPANDVQAIRGKGITGIFDGEAFWLGSHRYVVERGQNTIESGREAEALEAGGNTVIVVGNARHICGLIAVADTVRPEAKDVVRRLREDGVRHVVMLTGDNRITANAIARAVGIDQVYAELSPEDKVEKVDQLVERYGVVAMVGDGVNDAPALARASLGIAMGAIGSDAAIETADIALMTDDISKLPWLVRHAKWTLAVIRQNIVFSLVVKAAFVVLTFAGLATLWGAIAADAGASLAVVMNALRLLRPFDEQRDSAPAERPAPRSSKRKVVVWMSGATGALLLGLALIAGWRTFSIPEPQGLEQAPPTASKEVDQTPPTEPAPRQKSDESAPASRSPSSTREHKKPVLPDVSALEVPSSDPKAKLIALLEKDPSPGASRSVDLDEVIFEEGKSKPSLSGRRQLEAIVKILRSYPDRRIIVGGHTDRQGNPRANKRLSEKRAQFVLRELVEMGVSASRLQARGYGGDRPVARDDTREGETKNRRISLEVIEHR